MTKLNLFLIKATSGREAVMRLPVTRCGAITTKGFELVRKRFYDGSTDTYHGLKCALNLEACCNADSLGKALVNYQKNII